ncbi:hypothetical protein ETB97_000244 [Aspergillus alliaceus]|uniref:Uncharacterized protein n=1 Tax=Petromyces alliaceus TaxID=209559 RepID=A0A5N6GB63_PETAA|nr:uncharacterized protein BDW43DRAFT_307228 [Aspergillus alliaceus]KAB8237713.1 hypothetical protein BDW43DRAFT_307228 [Aspergillus alliaceus]KAF5866280.1 hypothetical protein ETB97_000244 [Aspergillus burnettii]
MILCFALTQFHGSHLDPIESGVLHRRDEILEDLDIAKCLWENDADRSIVARRAATAITSALKQDFDKSNSPTLIPSDEVEDAPLRERSATIGHPTGLMPGPYSATLVIMMPGRI